jgi:hypothetical protein
MTVPRDASPLTVFIQISLAIQLKPNALPVATRSSTHAATLFQNGMTSKINTAALIPHMTERRSPSRAIAYGYNGPITLTATRLTAMTAPTTKLELPERFKTIAIKGGSKPKIKPTPRLVENTAPNTQFMDRSLISMRSAAHVGPHGHL